MRVSVVIPALNEEAAIGRVIADLPREPVIEVIVVDGGSTDRTREVAADHGARSHKDVLDLTLRRLGAE